MGTPLPPASIAGFLCTILSRVPVPDAFSSSLRLVVLHSPFGAKLFGSGDLRILVLSVLSFPCVCQ